MTEVSADMSTGLYPSLFGHELAWERRGPAGAPTVVLLHGLATDRQVMLESFEPVLAEAQPQLQRLYLDLPGHGASKANLAAVSSDELVETLAAFLRAVAPGPVALVGYAFGGYLTQGLVRELGPKDVRGAFLVCPTVEADFGRRTVPPRRVLRSEDALVFPDAGVDAGVDGRLRAAFEEVAVLQTQSTLDRFAASIHPANIAANQEVMAATRARYVMSRPYLQSLAGFDGAVSVLCGRDDHWVGFEDAVRLVRAFRRGELHVLADCGHLLPIEATAYMQRALADWLNRLV